MSHDVGSEHIQACFGCRFKNFISDRDVFLSARRSCGCGKFRNLSRPEDIWILFRFLDPFLEFFVIHYWNFSNILLIYVIHADIQMIGFCEFSIFDFFYDMFQDIFLDNHRFFDVGQNTWINEIFEIS